ncbi:MAG: hydroxymethylglutaryl-CoA synthase [archaeon]
MSIGIVGYGAYVPRFRIKAEEIAAVWGGNAESVKAGLLIREKSVASVDEDTVTISVQAAKNAFARAQIPRTAIGAVFVGSESHPYAVKPSAGIVAQALGSTPHLTAADFEFACKAGTTAIQTCLGLVAGGYMDYGLAIGADTAQGAPGDALEYTTASGGAAYLIGKKKVLAEIKAFHSYTTDTPDFWRREGAPYPSHGGRFTGDPAYFKHVCSCTEALLQKIGKKPKDFDYVVFHQPNGKFPRRAAEKLGFTEEQYLPGMIVQDVGNTYSGCSPLALSHVLDKADANQTILMTSYGSGAGSDSFYIKTTKHLKAAQKLAPTTQYYIDRKEYINYTQYAKMRGKFKLE